MDQDTLSQFEPKSPAAADIAAAIENITVAKADANKRALAATAEIKANALTTTSVQRRGLQDEVADAEADVAQCTALGKALEGRLKAANYVEGKAAAELGFSQLMKRLNSRMRHLDKTFGNERPHATVLAELGDIADAINSFNSTISRGYPSYRIGYEQLRQIGAIRFCDSEAGREFIRRAVYIPAPAPVAVTVEYLS